MGKFELKLNAEAHEWADHQGIVVANDINKWCQ